LTGSGVAVKLVESQIVVVEVVRYLPCFTGYDALGNGHGDLSGRVCGLGVVFLVRLVVLWFSRARLWGHSCWY